MKKNRKTARFALHTETLRRLGDDDLTRVAGGIITNRCIITSGCGDSARDPQDPDPLCA